MTTPTALIIPAAGKGSRLGLPYPKELYSIEQGKLLIDYSLEQAANAGVYSAVIVTSEEKLRTMAQALGTVRCGVQLTYVTRTKDDSDSLPGSVIRGCRRAQTLGFERFVVALPDVYYEEPNAVKNLLDCPSPSFGLFSAPAHLYDAVYQNEETGRLDHLRVKKPQDDSLGIFLGTWGLLLLDKATIARLRRLLLSTPAVETGDQHLLGELIDKDMKENAWEALNIVGGYYDLGTWESVHKFVIDRAIVPNKE